MAVTVELTEKYKVEIDELNKTLFKKRIRTKRNASNETYEAWEVVGYWNSFEQVFKKLLDIYVIEKLGDKKINEIKDLQKAIMDSQKEISHLIKNAAYDLDNLRQK